VKHTSSCLRKAIEIPRGIDEMLCDAFLKGTHIFDSGLIVLSPHKHRMQSYEAVSSLREQSSQFRHGDKTAWCTQAVRGIAEIDLALGTVSMAYLSIRPSTIEVCAEVSLLSQLILFLSSSLHVIIRSNIKRI
jgi:hypothetical protein